MERVNEATEKKLEDAMKGVDWRRAYELADDLARVFAPLNGAAREWLVECLDHPQCAKVMAPNVQDIFEMSSGFLIVGNPVNELEQVVNESIEDDEDATEVAVAEESPAAA